MARVSWRVFFRRLKARAIRRKALGSPPLVFVDSRLHDADLTGFITLKGEWPRLTGKDT